MTELRCWYCGVELTLLKKRQNTATADHKIPQSCGGSDEAENIVQCCRSCNSRKWARTVDEYREWIMSDPTWKNGMWILWDTTLGHLVHKFGTLYTPDEVGQSLWAEQRHVSDWVDVGINITHIRNRIGNMVTVHKFCGENTVETFHDYQLRLYHESPEYKGLAAYLASKKGDDKDGDDFSLFMAE